MKRLALLSALVLPLLVLLAFSAAGLDGESVTICVVSATGEPVAIAGTVLGPFDADRSPVVRVSGATPYEVTVGPGDFAAAFWASGGGPSLAVAVISGADTTWSHGEPAWEHLLVDRRGKDFYMVGSALGQ